jgi:hypothetical protein
VAGVTTRGGPSFKIRETPLLTIAAMFKRVPGVA